MKTVSEIIKRFGKTETRGIPTLAICVDKPVCKHDRAFNRIYEFINNGNGVNMDT